MNAFLNSLWIQFKMDLREKGTLLTYYLVPLVFYMVVGAVFSSINPESKKTLAASMSIFAITMGAVLGMPAPLVKMSEAGVLRAYRVNGIPGWSVLLVHALSAFLHLLVVTVIITATAPVIFGAGLPKNFLYYILSFILLLFASISLGLLIGVTARSQSVATMLSQAVFLPTVLLGGIMFPASMLPEPLRLFGYVLPSTHAMEAFASLAYWLPSNGNAQLALLVMAGIGIFAAGLSAAIYRSGDCR